jgi:hypothetical protein
MHTTYKLKANELNEDFLQSVKALFHDKTIEIDVSDITLPKDNKTLIMPRKAGALAGRIKMNDDFNEPLSDFAEYQQ